MTDSPDNPKLTDEDYWVEHFKATNTEKENIIQISSGYDPYWETLYSNAKDPKTILEIGAFPGRYLAYLASKYSLKPIGIDFNPHQEVFDLVMKNMGVQDYEYRQVDFLKMTDEEQFDIIFSMGFVEHFENYMEIMQQHAALLKPGGTLMINIPNKKYLRKIYGLLCDHENLKAHNLNTMDLSLFRNLADQAGLEILQLKYFGGFAYKVHQELNFLQKVIYKITRLFARLFDSWIKKHPSKLWSGAIVAIYKKPLS